MKESTANDVEVLESAIRGNHLKRILDEKGITQEEAARRVGISYRHFNRIVLEQGEPSLLLAMRFVTVLGEPIERLWNIKIKTRRRSPRAA